MGGRGAVGWIASALGTTPSSVQSFRSRVGIRRTHDRTAEDLAQEHESDAFSTYEGVLETGEAEGYGLWLDPAVADDPVFRKGLGQVDEVEVRVLEDRIVLTPARARDRSPIERTASLEEGASQIEAVFGRGARRAYAGPNEERGSVRWYEAEKGYGFIYRPNGHEIFFHHSEIKGTGTLKDGTEVCYEVGENERGPIATGVRRCR